MCFFVVTLSETLGLFLDLVHNGNTTLGAVSNQSNTSHMELFFHNWHFISDLPAPLKFWELFFV
jgi:hypothetical protein